MEGIINNPFSGQKYIQNGKVAFEDITDQSQVKDTSNAVKTTESVLKKDVYIAGSASSDVCGMEKRQKVLTPDMASALSEKYDVKNMTRDEYGKLLQELRDSGVISSKDFSVGFGGEVPYTEPDGVQMALGSTDWVGIDTWPSGNEKVDFTKLLRACARYCTDFASKQEEGSDGEIMSSSLSDSYTRLLKIFEQIDSAARQKH